jgi:O-antigen ligase
VGDPPAQSIERVDGVIRREVAIGGSIAAGVLAALSVGEPGLLVVAAGVVVLVASLLHPGFGVGVLAALEVTRASLVLEELHDVPSFVVPFSAIVLVAGVLWWPPHELPGPSLLLPVILLVSYGAVLLVGVFHADEPGVVWAGTQSYAKEMLAVLAVLVVVGSAGRLRAAVWGVVLAGLVVAAVNVGQHLTGTFDTTWYGFARPVMDEVAGVERYRIGGPLADPNFFAQTLVVVVALAVERTWNERALAVRLVAGTAAALGALAVVFTNSRGGWIGLAAVAVLGAWRARPRATTAVAVAVALVLVVALAPDRYRDSVQTLVDPVGSSDDELDDSLTLRADQYRVAIAMVGDHPLLGVGWSNFEHHYLDYAARLDIVSTRDERAVHSVVLETAAESGLVGLAVFVAVPVGAFAALARARRRLQAGAGRSVRGLVDGIEVAFAGFVVTALFLPLSSPQVFWLLVALAFASPTVAERTMRGRPVDTRPVGSQPVGA